MTALTRTLLVGVVVPLLIAAAGIVAILVALPELPDPIAVHWGLSGAPDGSGPVWVPLVTVAVVPTAFAVFVLLVCRPSGERFASPNQRILVAASPFLAAVITATIASSTVAQRGVATWTEAPEVTGVLLAAFGSGIALVVGGWFLLPRAEDVAAAAPTKPMPLAATEQAVWVQRVRPQRTIVVVLAVAGTLVAGLVTLVWFVAPVALAIGFTALMVLIVVMAAGTLSWRVTVGASGLRVRSVVGVPDYRVPLADVASAASIQVDPVRDFGGWGIRWGGHRRWGVVARRGSAIEVRRRDGSTFVVTVPQAGEGAALLAALAGRDSS